MTEPVDPSSANNEIEQQLFTLMRRTVAIHLRTSSGAYELERSAYGILCLIDDHGPQRLGQIAQTFNLDPSTITRQVQAVVRLGLAVKETDPSDRRATLLNLTPEGADAVHDARTRRRRMMDAIVADWTEDERAGFARALRRFNDTISGWIESGQRPS